MNSITHILNCIEQGDSGSAEKLLLLVYEELRRLAENQISHEKPGQTLQATALVHEAYLRLVDRKEPCHWNSKGHFFGAAAEAMRRILIEQARRKNSEKLGAGQQPLQIDAIEPGVPQNRVDLLELNEVLQELEARDSEAAQVVKLRYFAGLTIQETSQALGVSVRTVNRDWVYAKAFLLQRLSKKI